LYLSGLSIFSGSGPATLDLGNNEMFLTYPAGSDPVGSIRAWLTGGYSAGAWNGTGIDSSAANARNTAPSTPLYGLGYADSADGSGVVTPPNTILVMFTVEGDANLDGTTNTTDFTTVSRNFGAGGTWDTGDFNYDGTTQLADLLILTRNFGKSA